MTEIARLLTAARKAHQDKKHASGKVNKDGMVTSSPNAIEAQRCAREALELRTQADQLDPQRTDPAWMADTLANRGVTSAEVCASLTRFLEPVPTPEAKSIDEIAAAVRVKAGDPVDSHAYALLLLESGWIQHADLAPDLQTSQPFARFRSVA